MGPVTMSHTAAHIIHITPSDLADGHELEVACCVFHRLDHHPLPVQFQPCNRRSNRRSPLDMASVSRQPEGVGVAHGLNPMLGLVPWRAFPQHGAGLFSTIGSRQTGARAMHEQWNRYFAAMTMFAFISLHLAGAIVRKPYQHV